MSGKFSITGDALCFAKQQYSLMYAAITAGLPVTARAWRGDFCRPGACTRAEVCLYTLLRLRVKSFLLPVKTADPLVVPSSPVPSSSSPVPSCSRTPVPIVSPVRSAAILVRPPEPLIGLSLDCCKNRVQELIVSGILSPEARRRSRDLKCTR